MLSYDTALLSPRLRLRRFSIEDIPFIFSASRHAGFCDGMRWNPPATEEALIEPYLNNVKAWQEGTAYTFTIEKKDPVPPQLIGRIAIRWQSDSLWDIGFWTHPEHQGRGYMTEATSRLIDFGFTQLQATEIQAEHVSWNIASRRVLEKAGFKFFNRVADGFEKNSQLCDNDILSISREQWKQSKQD